jgi:DNA polymerase III delta prime subunit
VLFYNGSQEFTAYNKVLEVKSSPVQAMAAGVNSETPENVLRFESRLKAAEVVKRVLHCRSFSECWNFKLAKEKLLQDFDTVVQNVGRQLELNFMEDVERLLALRERTRYSWQAFIAEKGIPLFLMQYNNDFELVKKLLLAAYQRRQAFYILKQLKQFYSEHRTPAERHLLKELREKLAA